MPGCQSTCQHSPSSVRECRRTRRGPGAAYTWRGITKDGSFWPGRLDLLTDDRSVLKPVMGMVVDTTRLSSSTLRELKLNAEDSLVSDHLLLVADFQFDH